MIYRNSITRLADYFECNLFSYAGVQEDRGKLVEQYPDQEAEINSLQDKYIKWLTLRFGDTKSVEELHPIGDCIPTLRDYSAKESGISQKYRQNPEFKELIDSKHSPASRGWDNPSDIFRMNSDQMNDLLASAAKPKNKVEGLGDGKSYSLPEGDRIGKVGEWNLWLPTSRENSCKIAGYDPVTMIPYTTWCTARTSGSNLFYNYIGGAGGKCILFYIIKDNPQTDWDWLSVGFIDGKIYLTGQKGGLSVDRANNGLTEGLLQSILGGNYDQVIAILKQKSDGLGGASPAFSKIEAAAKDPKLFSSLIRGNTADEADMIIRQVVRITHNVEVLSVAFDKTEKLNCLDDIIGHNLGAPLANKLPDRLDKITDKVINKLRQQAPDSSEASFTELIDKVIYISKRKELLPSTSGKISKVLPMLAGDERVFARVAVAKNRSTPPELLNTMAIDKSDEVRLAVAENKSATPEVLNSLATDEEISVRCVVAGSQNAPSEALTALAEDEDDRVRLLVSKNDKTPPGVLNILARDNNPKIRLSVVRHENTSPETLTFLAKENSMDVRGSIAMHKSTSPETLNFLAADPDYDVKEIIARNINTPTETLIAMAGDEKISVRNGVAKNKNAPPEALTTLATDEDIFIRKSVAGNSNTPPETLTALAKDKNENVRWVVSKNSNAPAEALTYLAGDKNSQIREEIINRHDIPPEALLIMAKDEDDDIRAEVSENSNTPPEALAILSKDNNVHVRTGVARNSNTPPDILTNLMADTGHFVRLEATRNKNNPRNKAANLLYRANLFYKRAIQR